MTGMMLRSWVMLALILLIWQSTAKGATMFSTDKRFKASDADIEARIDGILAKLSLEEKIDLLGGKHQSTTGNEKKGIPVLKMADGPLGVHWWTDKSTAYPASICAAASWDREMSYKLGWGLGRDCRARGVHILLAPGVNIYRSPLCGRNFEYLGEDPYLAAQLVTENVKGVQSNGVATTVKHYAVNYQEFDRHNVSSDLDERTLREVYLPAFKAAIVDGGSGALMTGYNLVNGVHCSQHDYLNNKILRDEWRFDGLVMSDWVSTYSAAGAANGGLDLEMPDAQWLNREKLTPEVKSGKVKEEVIDEKLRRLLRLGICFGWLDNEQLDKSIPGDDPETAEVALDVARGGIVLLKNEAGLLPLEVGKIKKLAVLGQHAHPAVIGGGGSSYTPPNHTISVLDGLKQVVGDGVQVTHCPGVDPQRELKLFGKSEFVSPDGKPGLQAEYFDNLELAGEPKLSRLDERVDFGWINKAPCEGLEPEGGSVRWRGAIRVPKDGDYLVYLRCRGNRGRLLVNGEEVFKTEGNGEPTFVKRLTLKKDQDCELVLEHGRKTRWNGIHLGWEDASVPVRERQEALDAAKEADAVVLCVGFTKESEKEGRDREYGLAEELEVFIKDVCKENPATTVALFAGGSIATEEWLSEVKGLLHLWYPGQEGGRAAAEIIFGQVNPSGKLPITWEKRLEDRGASDNYHDDDNDKKVELTDGVFCGHRHFDKQGIEPLFPFGYGLSYTSFEYKDLKLSASEITADDTLRVSFQLSNTGKRVGAEVVQLYLSDSESSLPRPVKELKGFEKVKLEPGESKRLEIELDRRALQFYVPGQGWTVEAGEFEVLIGASATDIKLRGKFNLK